MLCVDGYCQRYSEILKNGETFQNLTVTLTIPKIEVV